MSYQPRCTIHCRMMINPPITHIPGLAWAHDLYDYFLQHLDRRSYPITMYGKQMLQPRLVARYADPWVSYTYSRTTLKWDWRDSILSQLKDMLTSQYWVMFNSALCNLYRDGNDSMWRHADDEKELWNDPIIVSVSLWASRMMKFRSDMGESYSLMLNHGDILIMHAWCQTHRQHSIPKTTKVLQPRINITFRYVQNV